MDRVTVEQMSRPIPYTTAEIAYARKRPFPERTPIPVEGDEVLCRLNEWGDVYGATVDRVQPEDDVDDRNLFQVELADAMAERLLLLEGRPVMSKVEDPWPTLWLVVKVPRGDGFVRTVHTHTREARLRGSAGWLPLDWRTRRRYLPAQLEGMVTDDGDRS